MFKDVKYLQKQGFNGFIPISAIRNRLSEIPNVPGIYCVLWLHNGSPTYLEESVGGWFKGKNPGVDTDSLQRKWVPDTIVLYIGKAGGAGSGSTLRSRLKKYLDFGSGKPVGHWGGRFIWQIKEHNDLILCWKSIISTEPADEEYRLIELFKDYYGKFPFANLVSGKASSVSYLEKSTAPKTSSSPTSKSNTMKIQFSTKKGSSQEISDFIQNELKRKGLQTVTAVEAGEWLDRAGKLKDSDIRPGLPLRNLLRGKKIKGQRQEPNRRWFIDLIE